MTWISLICLLALSSAVLGRSVSYGGDNYGSSVMEQPMQPVITRTFQPVQQGYGQETRTIMEPEVLPLEPKAISSYGSSFVPPTITKTLPVQGYGSSRTLSGYGSSSRSSGGYGSSTRVLDNYGSSARTLDNYGSSARTLDNYGSSGDRVLEPMKTQADILCQGQAPQTVIPIEGNRKFVVCLDDEHGVEQTCPKGLFYHEQSRRCERKLGPLDDPCSSYPCLNGGQCIAIDSSSWQCQCAPGFDGTVCELDSQHCDSVRPCGQDQDTICQSFRVGAALQHMCIFEGGRSYGFSVSQREQNPCQGIDGPQKLTYTNAGFLICDGETMHVLACPFGTIWDDNNKACSWPDTSSDYSGYGQSYGGQAPPPPKTLTSYGSYGSQLPPPPPPPTRTLTSYGSYGSQVLPPPPPPKAFTSYGSYGSQLPPPPPPPTRTLTSYGSYGSQLPPPPPPPTRTFTSYGSYGGQVLPPPSPPKVFTSHGSYGSQLPPPPPPPTRTLTSYGSYGSQVPPPPKALTSYGSDDLPLSPPPTRSFSSYGSEPIIEPPRVFEPKSFSYGGEAKVLPKVSSGY